MSSPTLSVLLQQTHFLRGADQHEIQNLVEIIKPECYAPGQTIVRQGAPIQGIYFIAEGQVKPTRRDDQGALHQGITLSPPDLFGITEIAFEKPWHATYKALQPTTVYRWPIRDFQSFLESHPKATESFMFAAHSRRLAERLRFPWLAEDEVVYGLARKHVVLFYQSLTLPIFLLLLAGALAIWGVSGGNPLIPWIAATLGGVGFLIGLWQWVDWRNDYYILTDRRAVWLEKVIGIYDRREEAPLHWVLSVSINTDVVGRTMGYGDVIIRTFTGKIVFKNLGNPQAMAALIEEHWRKMRLQIQETDRETMVQTLQDRLVKEETERATPGQDPLEEREPAPPSEQVGMYHWSLEMRFEDQGVITYRKHWAVLLRQILTPTLLILIAVAGFASGLFGRLFDPEMPMMLLAVGLLLFGAIYWWIYRFIDWANDLYQITPNEIVDVNKKPLASETRKVAPLKNILGTEVDRKGLVGLMLNYGDVVANVGTSKFIFQGVFDPNGVQQDIVQAQDAYLEREREKSRDERRREVVEWLSAYHDNIASHEPEEDG